MSNEQANVRVLTMDDLDMIFKDVQFVETHKTTINDKVIEQSVTVSYDGLSLMKALQHATASIVIKVQAKARAFDKEGNAVNPELQKEDITVKASSLPCGKSKPRKSKEEKADDLIAELTDEERDRLFRKYIQDSLGKKVR